MSAIHRYTYVYYTLVAGLGLATYTNKPTTPMNTNIQAADAVVNNIANMQAAYKGEITATAKYAAFAKQADEEGYAKIALLHQAVAAAEGIHAANHKAVIEDAGATVAVIVPDYKVKLTKDNLSDDINGEAYEAETMYPNFLKTAQLANNQTAYLSLTYAMKTEEKHKAFFEKAFDNLKHGTLNNLPDRYSVCPACGNTYDKVPNHCDFSLTAKEYFIVFK